MRHDGTTLKFSATDLSAFSSCRHRTLLDRLGALRLARYVKYVDPRLDMIRERGMEHERAYLERLRGEGRRVVAFSSAPPGRDGQDVYRQRNDNTLAAMRDGADVIYQGTLYDGQWLGLVDFLIRVERPGAMGAWSYEVADAKLAREARAAALLQTCVYSELLEGVQGVAPERVRLFLGGPDPREVSFRLAHFGAYYRGLKSRFLTHLDGASDAPTPGPEPVEACLHCNWRKRCEDERTEVDHLSLVAGITRSQRRGLEAGGVDTLAGLAALPLDEVPEGLRSGSFQRVREQARVQLRGRELGVPYHELMPWVPQAGSIGPSSGDGSAERGAGAGPHAGPAPSPAPRPQGLAALPAPSPHDLFFDLEGADHAFDQGLEYLWGVSDVEDVHRGRWALTPDEEKAALQEFLTRAADLVARHPGAHIYHYGPYEPIALKRLVGRYDVGTEELDALLQGQVFVDLLRVAKQGIVASVESYSLKKMEAFCGFQRTVDLNEALGHRIGLEVGLATQMSDAIDPGGWAVVEGYNRDDCVALRVLRDWLEGLRVELEVQEGRSIPRPPPPEIREEKDGDPAGEVRELMEALLAGVSDEPGERSPDEHVRWLMAHLLEWHRREDKSGWWDYFRLRELTVEELVGEAKALSGLEYLGEGEPIKRSRTHRYRFPPQETRLDVGDKGEDPLTKKPREIVELDVGAGEVVIKVGNTTEFDPHALQALLHHEIFQVEAQKVQLRKAARALLEGEEVLAAWSPASRALLRAAAPTFVAGGNPVDGGGHGPSSNGGQPGDSPRHPASERRTVLLPALAPDAPLLDRAREAVLRMEPGVFPVQGPPGTGKTYSGARMIRALLRAGHTVGVTGPSHKVITNLLDAVCNAEANDLPTPIHGLQGKKKEEAGCLDSRFMLVDGGGKVRDAEAARAEEGGPPFNLIAGTAWLWADERRERAVDFLFIDEAGQFSLANALAVAPAAPRLVLLGDPQQLNQPQKGIHPPGTEVSVLDHLAGEDGILTEEGGLFLGETWRMRPEITAFTSELFYEGKLGGRSDLGRQVVTLANGSGFQGVMLEPVMHQGNSRESQEEARAVTELFRTLLVGGATFTDRAGETRPLRPDDLLVVAPYNAQVDCIRRALAEAGFPGDRVGTVDRFQGQEAPVAIYSLASSSAEDAPRGLEFLYALDRLNVATSRARVATVVVANPRLLEAECKRPEQMRMVNALVRFGEMAGG